jgi:UDP-MurNAc hydroxylase
MIIDKTSAEDSGLFVNADGFRFLDLNDCHIKVSDLPQADVLASQFSGAIHFPQTYEIYDDLQKADKARTAVSTYVDLFHRTVDAVKPRYFIPSAGPFCFLHPALTHYNPQPGAATVFVEWEQFEPLVSDFFDPAKVLRTYPGDVVVADGTSCHIEERYSALNQHPNDTLEAYAERRADEIAPFYAEKAPTVTTAELADHWAEISRHNKRLLAFRSFSKKFIIEAYEQSGEFITRWYVHIGQGGPHVYEAAPDDFFVEYTFKLPMLMLRKVVDGESNWDEMVASHHMLLSRDPDVFDPQFFALLRYHHIPPRGRLFVIAGESTEMVPLQGAPGTLIQRYCPHAGEDLIEVHACNGTVVCPRHRWEWDVETGVCLHGGNLPLKIEHVEVDAANGTATAARALT